MISANSSFITLAPTRKARSATVSSFVGPNPGRSTILILILPFTLFIRRAAFTCCSTGATINKGRLVFITCSNTVCIFLMFGISEDTINTNGFQVHRLVYLYQ